MVIGRLGFDDSITACTIVLHAIGNSILNVLGVRLLANASWPRQS